MTKVKKPKPKKPSIPFLERTWVILVILLIFAPAGIYLLWTQKKYTPIIRVMLSILFGLLFVNNVMGLTSLDLEPKGPKTPQAQNGNISPSDGEPQDHPIPGQPQDTSPAVEYIPPTLPTPEFSTSRLLQVHFVDVGQGDCIIVQTPGGQTVLVDGGNIDSGELVTHYLRNLGVEELLAVVATHPHEDHIGGLITVLDSIPVKSVYMPNTTHTTATFQNFLEAIENSGANKVDVRVGKSIPTDELDMAMLFMGPNSNNYQSLNDYSAVLKVSFKDISFLLTGDAEAVSESEMVDYRRNVNSTVLKVGHHGSRTSSTAAFLEAVNPHYAVITSGTDNDYGYPHREAVNRLKAIEADIFRTDVLGTLIFQTDGEDIGVKKAS